LTDFRNHRLGFAFFAKVGQQQPHSRQALVARIEE
jgi:hypothetical protein